MFKLFMPFAILGLMAGCASAPPVDDYAETPAVEEAPADSYSPYATPETDTYSAYPQEVSPDTGGSPDTTASTGGYTYTGPATERVVYFEFDSIEVRSDSRAVVEANARYLLQNPNAGAVLEGHTDERGVPEYNIALGERRAKSVQRMMHAYGVPTRQIRVMSYGEARPAVEGHDEDSYSRNRRVEIAYR